jgi:penicillin amidase
MIAKWFGRMFFAAATLTVVASILGGAGYWWLLTSLPRTEGALTLPGLKRAVTLTRDKDGVPYIKAESEHDAYFTLGFAHAQDRLWQMELTRRIGAGRLAEVMGWFSEAAAERALSVDRFTRTLGLYRLAEQTVTALPEEVSAALGAYAGGVNAYLDTHDGALPIEFQVLRYQPEPWRPADSLVWGRLIAMRLGGDWHAELVRAKLARAGLTPAEIQLLWSAESTLQEIPTAPANPRLGELAPDALDHLLAALPEMARPAMASNAWAISGKHTETGLPILANDPHLAFTAPGLWYLVRMEAPGFLRVGGTVPGVPFLVVGHNGKVAWGMTSTQSDTQDLFVESVDPSDPTRYLSPDGPLPFETRVERISSGGEVFEHTVRHTRHGPVISDLLPRTAEAIGPNKAIALAAAGLAVDDDTVAALYRLNRAQGADQVQAALRGFHAPMQNVTFADTTGRFGMVTAGRMPVRPPGAGFLPADGATRAGDWSGWVPPEWLPRALDPEPGFLVQANNRVRPRFGNLEMGHGFDASYRAQRILRRLRDVDGTVVAMADIQMDAVSEMARDILPTLLAGADKGLEKDATARIALKLLRDWDGKMDRDKPEPLIFSAWLRGVHHRLLADDLGRHAGDFARIKVPVVKRILTRAPQWCNDRRTPEPETCGEIVSAALLEALSGLARQFGNTPLAWRWGQVHIASFKHRILGDVPIIGKLFLTEVATDGGDYTVNRGAVRLAASVDPYRHRIGAGFRAVYDLADLDRSLFALAMGQSGNPLSRHYDDLASAWADGGHRPLGRKPAGPAATLDLIPK